MGNNQTMKRATSQEIKKKKKKKGIYLLTTFCIMRSSDVSKVDSQSASQKVSTVLPVEIITITNLNVRIYQKKSPQ